MRRRQQVVRWIIVLGATIAALPGCRGANSEDEAIAERVPTVPATAGDRVALPTPSGPPVVENDAPAGICEDTANLLSRVDPITPGLFRATALDNRVGPNDGDGIRGVRFAVSGEGIAYSHDELTAPYCIFGSNEPDCGEWPRDDDGRYTWGVDGPVVQPGLYDLFVEVVGEQADSLSGSDRCDWSFTLLVEVP